MVAGDRAPRLAAARTLAAAAARIVRAARGACALLAACTVLAACGHDGGGAPAAGRSGAAGTAGPAGAPLPDACELLTPADVEAVTREASGSLSSTLEDAVGKDPTQCAYSLGGDATARMISIGIERNAPTVHQSQVSPRCVDLERDTRGPAQGLPILPCQELRKGVWFVVNQCCDFSQSSTSLRTMSFATPYRC